MALSHLQILIQQPAFMYYDKRDVFSAALFSETDARRTSEVDEDAQSENHGVILFLKPPKLMYQNESE